MEGYKELEKKTGVSFKDKDLLKKAFTHKSYINENRNDKLKHNERLEFLGDAVLELASTEHLFNNYPDQDEGNMTTFRSALVKGKHLAEVAQELDLGKYLFLSKGEEKSGGRHKNCLLANTMEAYIGAVYIEHGFEESKKFVEKFILTRLDEIIEKGLHIDAKSSFQETCQELEGTTPHYELIEEVGPDHDKQFTMGAYIGEELIAEGKGSSKQKAEDEAAVNALKIKKW